jgi:plasmid stability protein
MAQLIVRNIEDDVKERLRQRARLRGRSMEDEVRDILRHAVMVEPADKEGAGTKLAGYFADVDSAFEIPEMRGEEPRPATFKK